MYNPIIYINKFAIFILISHKQPGILSDQWYYLYLHPESEKTHAIPVRHNVDSNGCSISTATPQLLGTRFYRYDLGQLG